MRIFLGGHLAFYHPDKGNWLEVEVKQPTPLREILERTDIPIGEVHLVVINELTTGLQEAVISEKDDVKLYSAVGGG